jgi:hypothetical protein
MPTAIIDTIDAPHPRGMVDALGLTNSEMEQLRDKVRIDMQLYESQKWEWVVDRQRDVRNYFGIKTKDNWPFKGASKVASQFHRISVDTLVANTMKSLMLPELPVACEPTNSDSILTAAYVEKFTNAMAMTDWNIRAVLDAMLPNAFVESFSVAKPRYMFNSTYVVEDAYRWVSRQDATRNLTYDVDTATVQDKDTGDIIHSVELDQIDLTPDELKKADMVKLHFQIDKEIPTKDGIDVQVCGASRIYLPITAPGKIPWEKYQLATSVIHQQFIPYAEFVRLGMDNIFINTDEVAGEVFDRARELITSEKYQQAGFTSEIYIQKQVIEVIEWHGKHLIHGKHREVIVWVARKTGSFLRAELDMTGERGFVPIVPFPIDETPYGESLPKILRPLVTELDLLMSTVINISLQKSFPPKFYDPGGGFNAATVGAFGPNSWIPCREPSRNVYIPPQPEDPAVAMEMIKLLINIIERVTSISEVVQGQISQKSNTTYGEVAQALARAGVRFDQIYERVKEQMRPLFDYNHKLYLRHMPMEREIRTMDRDAYKLSGGIIKIFKAQIKGQYNFFLRGGSILAETAELQKAIMLFNTIGQHPYMSYKPEGIFYTLYNIVRHLNPKAIDKILATPDEVIAIERQQEQVKQQQEQQALEQQTRSQQAALEFQKNEAENTRQHELNMEALRAQVRMGAQESTAPTSQA